MSGRIPQGHGDHAGNPVPQGVEEKKMPRFARGALPRGIKYPALGEAGVLPVRGREDGKVLCTC